MSAGRTDLPDSSIGANRDDASIGDEPDPPSGPTARVADLEARVTELTQALERVADRVETLEHREPAPSTRVVPSRPAAPRPSRPVEEPGGESLGVWATIVGRTFLILGGAYLLRALTEARVLPQGLGAAVAFGYAHVWLALAYRASKSQYAKLDRTAYGVVFAIIAFPLVVEVTTRFHLLSPSQGALGLALTTTTGLVAVWKGRLRQLSWVVSSIALLAAIGIALDTQAWSALMLVVVGAGVAVDFVANDRDWRPLRVSFASATDVVILGLYTPYVLMHRASYTLLVTVVPLSLFVGYMGLYSLRSLAARRSLCTFERIQASAVLVIGYVGAVIGALHVPGVSRVIACASLLMGGAAYAVAYHLFVRPRKNATESWFNTSYALVGVLVGSWVLLHDPAYAWMGIAVLLTLLGTRDGYAALPVHGAVFATFAAIASGLLLAAGYAFAAGAHSTWPDLPLQAFVALGVVAFVYVAPLESDATRRLAAGRVAKVLALVILIIGIGGVLVAKLLHPLVADGDAASDAAWLAALRTGVIVGAAVLVAAVSRTERFSEAGLLVYPLLAAGGVKLALEDLRNGNAVTLAIACVCYGAALVFAPRIQRRKAAA